LVDGEQFLHGLDFDDDGVFDDEVEAVRGVEGDALVSERDGALALEADRAKRQFVREALFVDRLEEAGPQVAVYLDARANHGLGTIHEASRLSVRRFHLHLIIGRCVGALLEKADRGKRGGFRRGRRGGKNFGVRGRGAVVRRRAIGSAWSTFGLADLDSPP
jgi:hypothetical protein